MEKIYLKVDPTGVHSYEINVTVEEWQEILSNKKITTDNYKKALLAFYHEPEHKATCKTLGMKYYGNAKDAQKFNSWITQFGVAVVKHLNRFRIYDLDGKERFWPVSMSMGKDLDSGLFETTLRPELVKAIENLGWNKLFTWIPFFMEMADKLLEYKDKRKELLDLIYGLDVQYVGYIKDKQGNHMSDFDPFSVFGIINRGLVESKRVAICDYFKEKLGIEAETPSDFSGVPVMNPQMAYFFWRDDMATSIQPLWELFESVIKNDEANFNKWFDIVSEQRGVKWNITIGFFWIRPFDYISLDSRNRIYLPKFGVDVFQENQFDAAHYMDVLHKVKQKLANHEIKEKDIPEISYNAWLNNESVEDRKFWLVGYSFGSNDSQLDRFINESIWEGGFDKNKTVDQNQLALAKTISKGDVIILKSTATKGKNHDKPFMRIKAVGVVAADPITYKEGPYTRCKCEVDYINKDEKDFDGKEYGSYRKTVHIATKKAQSVIDYVNSLLNGNAMDNKKSEDVPKKKYQEYIDLLTENYNLVLTGAPGTGKTYMAQAIADEMGAESMFVQFHPSYDYTDFVEGLRPVEKIDGQLGFERRDGAFKEFCRKAIKNLVDSRKSVESLTKEVSWEEKLQLFVEDAVENDRRFTLTNGSEFGIEEIKGRFVVVHNEQNEKTARVAVNADDIIDLLVNEVSLNNVKDIRNHFGRKFGTQPDSYAFIITKEVRKSKETVAVAEADKVHRKPFVFIIDEINRGEVSKIFGELFYAIDPGYRGQTAKMVQTQYQNLIPESDVFAKGFYVPENVYILATMNDIDRSVESMDFAIRRRFTWKEVAPDDTESMLNVMPCGEEAKVTMRRLNDAIASVNGLGTAYKIGPSYFLKLASNGGDFERLWSLSIEPLLKEYLRGSRKAKETLELFEKAYFNVNKEAGDSSDLVDEN